MVEFSFAVKSINQEFLGISMQIFFVVEYLIFRYVFFFLYSLLLF